MSDAPLESRQQIIDQEHLRLLAIFYYVMGGMCVAFSCFFLLYVFMGLMMALGPHFMPMPRGGHNPGAANFGYVIAGFGSLFVLMGWTFGGLTILAGRGIQKRKWRTLTFVIAALNCLSLPFGLLLGICTFLVLSRHSVSRMYDAQSQ